MKKAPPWLVVPLVLAQVWSSDTRPHPAAWPKAERPRLRPAYTRAYAYTQVGRSQSRSKPRLRLVPKNICAVFVTSNFRTHAWSIKCN